MPSIKSIVTAIAIGAGLTEAYWQPTPNVGLTWNYQLSVVPTTNPGRFKVWAIDLFETPAKTIAGLKKNGAKVICYFSAGTWEEWRPDAGDFRDSDLGNDMDDWEGERWVKTSSNSVRQLMAKRLDMAVKKGCDAVDPDNIDAYDADSGFRLTKNTAVSYVNFLAKEAHDRNLAIGLKNSGGIVKSLVGTVDFAVNEQCAEYNECASWQPFIQAAKPVFRVEYPKGEKSDTFRVSDTDKNMYCKAKNTEGFNTIIKNMELDEWSQDC